MLFRFVILKKWCGSTGIAIRRFVTVSLMSLMQSFKWRLVVINGLDVIVRYTVFKYSTVC